MERLVWPMCVRAWAEDPGHEELRAREALAELGEERDRPTFAHRARRSREDGTRRVVDRIDEPSLWLRGDPPLGWMACLDRDPSTCRRICRQGCDPRLGGQHGIDVRRNPKGETGAGGRTQHVACVGERWRALEARDGKGRRPRLAQQPIGSVATHQLETRHGREGAAQGVAELVGDLGGGSQQVVGRLGVELREEHLAGERIFDAIEELTKESERARDDATGLARVDAVGEHFDADVRHDIAPKRAGHPEAIEVERT